MSDLTLPYLAITDGTTTVILQDAVRGTPAYLLDSLAHWVPSIPTLTENTLAGRGPVSDTEEELPVIISGKTPADVTAKRAVLINLLDQARRWSKGENVSAVRMEYVPAGSANYQSGAPLQAAVLGRVGDESGVPIAQFERTGDPRLGWCQQINVRLRRRGQWLGTAESASSSAAGSGARHHIVFPSSHSEFSPLKVVINDLTPGAALSMKDSFILVARNKAGTSDVTGSYLQSYAAETMTATGWTAVASAGNNPLGTNVLRYTPTGTTFVASGALTLTSPLTLCKHIYVYATLRNNNATRTFQVYGEFTSLGGTKTLLTSGIPFVDASTQQPRAIFIGAVALPVDEVGLPNATYPTFKLYAAVSSTTGSPTLDFDNLVFLGCDDEGANVTTIRAFTMPNQANTDLTIDPQALTLPKPTCQLDYTGVTDLLSYEGNLWPSTILDRVTCLWLTTQGTNWRFANNANALQTFTITATRRLSYLTPQ